MILHRGRKRWAQGALEDLVYCLINLPTVFPQRVFFPKGAKNFERKQEQTETFASVNQTHVNHLLEKHQPALKKGEKNRKLLFMDDV